MTLEQPQLQQVGYFDKLKREVQRKMEDKPKRTRGKICVLCDRKFILNQELGTSLKQIDIQNMTITSLQ